MDYFEIIGLCAAFCTTFAFLPQLIKSWNTKSVKDFSWGMLGLYVLGVFLWLVYGLSINSLPMILANILTEIFVLVLVALKFKFG
ncbi:MAG: SemiSWEET family sugar transporter [Candidatus Bilamarchaeaceae archaeon]